MELFRYFIGHNPITIVSLKSVKIDNAQLFTQHSVVSHNDIHFFQPKSQKKGP